MQRDSLFCESVRTWSSQRRQSHESEIYGSVQFRFGIVRLTWRISCKTFIRAYKNTSDIGVPGIRWSSRSDVCRLHHQGVSITSDMGVPICACANVVCANSRRTFTPRLHRFGASIRARQHKRPKVCIRPLSVSFVVGLNLKMLKWFNKLQ